VNKSWADDNEWVSMLAWEQQTFTVKRQHVTKCLKRPQSCNRLFSKWDGTWGDNIEMDLVVL
jgi:hypothetical protein